MNISRAKKDIPEGKAPFFFTLKSLSNGQGFFLLHRHFKAIVSVQRGML